MNYLTLLPVWNRLDEKQQQLLADASVVHEFRKGHLLHNGSADCMGLFLVLSGQLRAFTVSADGREITLYRLFERDICLFSASCIMNSIQFDISISVEKDAKVLIIPSDVYKSIMEISAPLRTTPTRSWQAGFPTSCG